VLHSNLKKERKLKNLIFYRTYLFLTGRDIDVKIKVLRNAHQVVDLVGVSTVLAQQQRQRWNEVLSQLGTVVVDLLYFFC